MAQPSILRYFNCRKRPGTDDYKLEKPAKLLKLNEERPKVAPQRKLIKDQCSNKELVNQLTKVVKQVEQAQENTVANNAVEANSKTNKVSEIVSLKDTENTKGNAELNNIKNNLRKNKKLADLKKSLNQFKKASEKLETLGKRNEQILESLKPTKPSPAEPKAPVSSQKLHSAEKPALVDAKSTLQLPFKYRTLNEIFRAVDTIVQIMYNRQEVITFKKLKPAVEELAKRTFHQTHLAQIKSVHPDAYDFAQKRLKCFGTRMQEEWDLVLTPTIKAATMTTVDLLDRRRHFHNLLIDRVKDHHSEFLASLTPPLVVARDAVATWHPDFPLEKVPDVELAGLPETPNVEVHTSGKQVLETARRLFNSNARLNQAPSVDAVSVCETAQTSVKGIPEALLKKVREKQASKALLAMTKSAEKEKQRQMYGRLPELARFVRNLFVTERKSVLPLDVVLEKLGNSYRSSLNKSDMEHHLRLISKEAPGWLVFHTVRNCVFIKLSKNADLGGVLTKLEQLVTQMKDC